jgi:hypothetical protein
MPVIIHDIEAEITPEAAPAGAPGAGEAASASPDHAAVTPQPVLLTWVALRDLAAEREARLAID